MEILVLRNKTKKVMDGLDRRMQRTVKTISELEEKIIKSYPVWTTETKQTKKNI